MPFFIPFKNKRLALGGLALMMLCLAGPLGCSFFQPTLHAKGMAKVPLPNALVETDVWESAPTLKVEVWRGAGKTRQRQIVELKAIHDGRVISILARWSDPSESLARRTWVWDDQRNDYKTEDVNTDQFAMLWPLSRKASFNMLDGRAAKYDVWQWRAGWSDLSGYADDRYLILKPHPKGTAPASVAGALYPSQGGGNMTEFLWGEDSGRPGTQPTPKPDSKLKLRMPGAQAGEASGSAADIRAHAIYTPRLHKGQGGKYRIQEAGDNWFVEFYRLLVTGGKDEDYQIRGRGPHECAIGVWDGESGADHFTSGRLRLVLDKVPS